MQLQRFYQPSNKQKEPLIPILSKKLWLYIPKHPYALEEYSNNAYIWASYNKLLISWKDCSKCIIQSQSTEIQSLQLSPYLLRYNSNKDLLLPKPTGQLLYLEIPNPQIFSSSPFFLHPSHNQFLSLNQYRNFPKEAIA